MSASALRRLPAFIATSAALLVAVPSADAWEAPIPSAQHRLAHAEFLIFAPPPAQPGAACFIDSGLDVNADTQPNILSRTALDGGSPDDLSPSKHGSHMASAAGAVVNGWASVGAWPQLKLVSIRASAPGTDSFPFDEYRRAIHQCYEAVTISGLPIRAISMSLGGTRAPDSEALERLVARVVEARAIGINLVASAGNTPGSVYYPARIPQVLGVGASGAGGLCSFSASGEGLDIMGPGCFLEMGQLPAGTAALQAGTSQAAAFVSGVLVALRSYRPDLTVDQAEQILTSTAGGGTLNADAAFRAAGLGAIVDQGNAALAAHNKAPDGTTGGVAVDPCPNPPCIDAPQEVVPTRLRLPKATVTYKRGVLRVKVKNRPSGATVRMVVRARKVKGSRKILKKVIYEQNANLSLRQWLYKKRLHDVTLRFEPDAQDYDVLMPSRVITWKPKAKKPKRKR